MRRSGDLFPVRGEQQTGLSSWGGSSLLDPSAFFSTSPWQTMRRMQDEMDRVFSQFFQPTTQPSQRAEPQWVPSVDISQDDREWLIEAELPGVRKDQIQVEVRGDQLLLRAEMRQEQDEHPQGAPGVEGAPTAGGWGNGQAALGRAPQRQYYHRERRYGYFQRVLPLPENVNQEQISCEFQDGILKLHLPKRAQQPQSRRIPIGESLMGQLTGSQATDESQQPEPQNGRTRAKKGEGELAGTGSGNSQA